MDEYASVTHERIANEEVHVHGGQGGGGLGGQGGQRGARLSGFSYIWVRHIHMCLQR